MNLFSNLNVPLRLLEGVFIFKATVGKCNTPKPGMLDMVGKYKWNAWNDLGSLSQVHGYNMVIVWCHF